MEREEVFSILKLDEREFETKEKTFRLVIIFSLLPIALKSLLFYFLLVFVLFQYPFYQIKKKAEKKTEQIQYDFSIWLYQMNCYLQHHTVLNAMKASLQKAPSLLYYDLKKMLEKLAKDPNNLHCYQSFLSHYDLLLIHESMRLFHRFNYLDQKQVEVFMAPLFKRCQKDLRKMRNEKYQARFSSKKIIFVLPMFLLVYVFIRMMSLVMMQVFERGWMI